MQNYLELKNSYKELCLQHINKIIEENISLNEIKKMKQLEKIAEQRMNNAKREIDNVQQKQTNKKTKKTKKIIILNKKDSTTISHEECSICNTNHFMVESCITECQHTFGEACLKKWFEKSKTCPNCRFNNPCISSYRLRKSLK
jgi:hypothetical protein